MIKEGSKKRYRKSNAHRMKGAIFLEDLMKITNCQYGIRSPLPDDPVVAMAYVPYQQEGKMYCPDQAIMNGTIFPELNKPFCCGREGKS